MQFDVSDAVDLHVHCGPEGIPRKFDALQMARHAKEWRLRSIVLKSHFGDTSAWAQMACRETGVRLVGSITLNHYVGGINPMAVRGALGPRDEHGSFLKVVWLPTVHADSHLCVHCAAGDEYDIPAEWAGGVQPVVSRRIDGLPRISVLAPEVQPQLREVLEIVAEHDLVLATGHVGRDEVYHVLDLARQCGVEKCVVTHAQYSLPGLDVGEMVELAKRGAYIELCYVLIDLGMVTAKEVADAFRQVGASRIILSTDVGQVDRSAGRGPGAIRESSAPRRHSACGNRPCDETYSLVARADVTERAADQATPQTTARIRCIHMILRPLSGRGCLAVSV